MAENKFKDKINMPQATDSKLDSLFTGNTSAIPTKEKHEKASKTKLLSMKPSVYEKINTIALAKGYDLNSYINLLIEREILTESRNMAQYEADYKVLMQEKADRKQKREATREYNRLLKEQKAKENE